MIITILSIFGAVFLTIILIILLLLITGRIKTSVTKFDYDDVEQSIMSELTVSESLSPQETAEVLIRFFEVITDKHPTHDTLIAMFAAEKSAKNLASLTAGKQREYWLAVKNYVSEKLQHPENIHEFEGE